MTIPPKGSTRCRLLLTSVFLPFALQGCSTVGGVFDDGGDYLDYTTDRLNPALAPAPAPAPAIVDAEPVLAAALPQPSPLKGIGNQSNLNVYAAAGIGVSQLTPDTSDVDGYDVDDDFAGGGQIGLGLDLNKHLSLEMHSADLGSAGISPEGRVNYYSHGLSALYYVGKDRNNPGRRGFSGYGRLGVSLLDNSSIGNITYERTDKTQMLFGAGLEYNTRKGLGFRAEATAFEQDALYSQLGMVYRFGGKSKPRTPVALETPTDNPLTETEAEVAEDPAGMPTLAIAPVTPEPTLEQLAPKDSDNDGIADSMDQCAGTGNFVSVDTNGCALFTGTLEGVNFKSNSAQLTLAAATILDGVSNTLIQYPGAQIRIAAHTDNGGDAEHNQALSAKRALAVVNHLAARGIPYSRMSARAYGERKPAASNDTAAGRASNRRVELFATQRPSS